MIDSRDPFDIEGVSWHQVDSTRDMNAKVREIIDGMTVGLSDCRGPVLPIYLIAQTSAAIHEIQQWASRSVSGGVAVVTYKGMIADLWSLYGDAREIADAHQIRYACRKAMMSVMGDMPSLPALRLAEKMLDVALAADDARIGEIAAGKEGSHGAHIAARIVIESEQNLTQMGFVHANRASHIVAGHLCHDGAPVLRVISEDPSENDADQQAFYRAIAKTADIAVVRRDASGTDLGSMVSDLDCRFAVSFGAHAYRKLVADAVEMFMGEGVPAGDIAVVMNSLGVSSSKLFREFDKRSIPFEANIAVGLIDTPLGSWFLDVERWRECVLASQKGIPAPYPDDQLSMFIEKICGSPYCSAWDDDEKESAMFDWAHGTPPQDIGEDDFRSLLVGDDRYKLLSYLTEGTPPEALDTSQIIDDADVAKTIGDFLRSSQEFEQDYNIDDLELSSVKLTRSLGDDGERVLIMTRTDASYDRRPYIVMCDLDAFSCKGFSAPSPFACLTDMLGVSPDAWLNSRILRFQVVDMLKHASHGAVTLTRSATDLAGNELPVSPLYDEMSAPFGSIEDDGIPDGIPDNRKIVVTEAESVENVKRHVEGIESYEMKQGVTVSDGSGIPPFAKKRPNGKVKFSPTALELYWACPRKWFASRGGVGYDEVSDPSFAEARTRGSVMHSTFESYYGAYGREHYRADLDEDKDAADALRKAFDDAVEKAFEGYPMPDEGEPSVKYAKERLFSMAKAVIQRDISFLPGFSPKLMEDYVEGEIAGLRIGGIIDRVDISDERNANGKFDAVIIDYKGSPDGEYEWNGKADPPQPGLHIQGLLYAMLFEEKHPDIDVVGVVYRGYSNSEDRGMACVPMTADGKAQMSREQFEENMETFSEMFSQMASDLAAGRFNIAPRQRKTGACRFCPLEMSCSGRKEL